MAQKKNTTRMRLGGVYVNAYAGKENPQRAGVYIGRRGKLVELLHADGSRSQYKDSRSMVYGGIQLFDRDRMRNWFAYVVGQTAKEAERVRDRLWEEEFGRPPVTS